VEKAEERKGIGIDLTLRELNPNHRYRMALMGLPPFHWLAELGVVKRDESLYLMPLIEREYTVSVLSSTGHVGQYQVLPNSGLHISYHDSGAVKATFGAQELVLRNPTGSRAALGPVFAFIINSSTGLREAALDEVNAAPAKKRVLPLLGAWRPGPVGVTVYRSASGTHWTAPVLADLVQANVHLPVRAKSVQYHVVVWQNDRFRPPPGDLAIYFPPN
jgi:hypothetical protein